MLRSNCYLDYYVTGRITPHTTREEEFDIEQVSYRRLLGNPQPLCLD